MGSPAWKVGFKKGATWGTAVSLGAGDGLLIAQESMPEGIPEPIPDENIGQSLSGVPMQGNVKVEGNFGEPVRYDGFERRLALFTGDDTVSEKQAAKAWEHAMLFKPSNKGFFGTLAIDKGIGALGSNAWEYPSVKLAGLELAHDNGRLMATWAALANKCERSAPINDATEFAALSLLTSGLPVVFSQLRVGFKKVTGTEGNFAYPADEKLCSALSLSLNRNLAGDYVCGSAAGTIDEPDSNGFPEGTLKLTFPQHVAAVDALIKEAAIAAADRKPALYKIELIWTGPQIPTTAPALSYVFGIRLAAAVIESAPANAGSPGAKVPVELTFRVAAPDYTAAGGNGTDWSWVAAGGDPIRFHLQNGQQTAGD